MKVQVLLYGLIACTAVAAVLAPVLWRRPTQPPTSPDQPQAEVKSSTGPTQTVNIAPGASPGIGSPAPLPAASQPRVASEGKALKWLQQYVEGQNVPISFYGQFIDQQTNPVPGVRVQVSIQNEIAPSSKALEQSARQTDLVRTSDRDGRIEIQGEVGDSLSIKSVAKEGYDPSPRNPHSFGPSSGSYENPVLFKMWKTGEKPQLVGASKFWAIIPDGRGYTIDLLQGTKVESDNAPGDLRISVTRPAGVSRRDRYDWSFQITPVDGGITETEDDFLYRAPESGYTPRYDLRVEASDPQWTDQPRKTFYVKTRAGQNYGRMTLQVFAHYQNQSLLDIDYAVNPNASPNLQP